MNKRYLPTILFVLLCASPLWAGPLEDIQRHYAAHQDFTAAFAQDTLQVITGDTVHFTGTVSYQKPGRVRMDVHTPQRQIIILNGEKAWIFLPDEGTSSMQEIPREFASQNILAFFAGIEGLGDAYTVKQTDDRLNLTPKGAAGNIEVWRNPRGLIARIRLTDATGNRSDLTLDNYRFDQGLPASLFDAAKVLPVRPQGATGNDS